MGAPPSVYTGSGLGFSAQTPEDLRNMFQHAPWLFWIYNVTATFLTVVVSEPRAGVYSFVRIAIEREYPDLAMAARGVVPADDSHHRDGLDRLAAVVCERSSAAGGRCGARCAVAAGSVSYIRGIGSRCPLASATGCSSTLPSPRCSNGCHRSGRRQSLAMCAVAPLPPSGSSVPLKRMSFCATRRGTIIIDWTERFDDLGGYAQPPSAVLTTMRVGGAWLHAGRSSTGPGVDLLPVRAPVPAERRRFATVSRWCGRQRGAAAVGAVRHPLEARYQRRDPDADWKPSLGWPRRNGSIAIPVGAPGRIAFVDRLANASDRSSRAGSRRYGKNRCCATGDSGVDLLTSVSVHSRTCAGC